MKKWGNTKILIAIIITLVILVFSFNSIDPLYLTGKTLTAEVTHSAQMFPRYRDSYNRTIVKLENGELHTFETPLNYKIKAGNKVILEILKRRKTGFITYKLKY